ncbi:protein of unknown function [Candidatus Methylomirabilis oxygeniifera]|uniref:Uncharacterized protein n=1 Tax=Methylomirabilis oxygeniifera TaxID=671143 RepID=D5MLR6_METO1|nr:protein of unknown function [Candidatus Methylomirabilis oxyfera]
MSHPNVACWIEEQIENWIEATESLNTPTAREKNGWLERGKEKAGESALPRLTAER